MISPTLHAERGVDVSAVQTVDKPTRDVLVVYDSDGDRQFVGFGGPNDSFADCFISSEKLPLDTLKSCAALVTGTLGLAFPSTAAAMHKAVQTARTGSAVVSATSTTFLAALLIQCMCLFDCVKQAQAGRESFLSRRRQECMYDDPREEASYLLQSFFVLPCDSHLGPRITWACNQPTCCPCRSLLT